MDLKKFNTVDEYIAAQPKEVQPKLKQLRKAIREASQWQTNQSPITCLTTP
jgi:hypothetical protein